MQNCRRAWPTATASRGVRGERGPSQPPLQQRSTYIRSPPSCGPRPEQKEVVRARKMQLPAHENAFPSFRLCSSAVASSLGPSVFSLGRKAVFSLADRGPPQLAGLGQLVRQSTRCLLCRGTCSNEEPHWATRRTSRADLRLASSPHSPARDSARLPAATLSAVAAASGIADCHRRRALRPSHGPIESTLRPSCAGSDGRDRRRTDDDIALHFSGRSGDQRGLPSRTIF